MFGDAQYYWHVRGQYGLKMSYQLLANNMLI